MGFRYFSKTLKPNYNLEVAQCYVGCTIACCYIKEGTHLTNYNSDDFLVRLEILSKDRKDIGRNIIAVARASPL